MKGKFLDYWEAKEPYVLDSKNIAEVRKVYQIKYICSKAIEEWGPGWF